VITEKESVKREGGNPSWKWQFDLCSITILPLKSWWWSILPTWHQKSVEHWPVWCQSMRVNTL